eukprot:TRINITY_DN15489_c0_g2_i1.p1 TRINITY_DN15489_c0_g2~~TRINITY_DN15489_c0_g2_i1.p1  ORF type:complete len:1163 (-),score=197.48 TRINITY_DN15489_c0_g2_i1:111-3341(-)
MGTGTLSGGSRPPDQLRMSAGGESDSSPSSGRRLSRTKSGPISGGFGGTVGDSVFDDCLAPPADYFSIVFMLIVCIWAVPMIGSVCSQDCAAPSWNFTGFQLIASGGLWVMFAVNGVYLLYKSNTSDVDGRRQRLGVWRAKTGPLMTQAAVGLAGLQCALFIFRSVTKMVSFYFVLAELCACSIFTVEFISGYLQAHLGSATTAIKFMFGRGIIYCLLVPSVMLLPVLEFEGKKSWFSLSFLGALQVESHFAEFLEVRKVDLNSVKGQMLLSTTSICTTIFAAAMAMMTLENLGDPEFMKPLNQGEWNAVSALYFMVSTMATVGYGDLVPMTTFGRMLAIFAVFAGVMALSQTLRAITKVRALNSMGAGSFAPPARAKHIVVAGNPNAQMAIDFIQEIFHADHDEKADELRCCFMFPRSSTALIEVRNFIKLKQNIRILPRVTLLCGNVLDTGDLARCFASKADRVFLMPDPWAEDATQEDTDNIVRMMALRKLAKNLSIVLLLLKAERMSLLRDAGMNQAGLLTCVAFDQFKMELVGKSCIVPGLSTLVCNLCKTMGGDDENDSLPQWRQEYERGMGNEIYEVELSQAYSQRGALFSEVVLDVLNQSEGVVYLIGLVETRPDGLKRILVNPGPRYPIKQPKERVQIQGIFIAPDHGAIVQCEAGTVFLGRRERPAGEKDRRTAETGLKTTDISGKHRANIDEGLLSQGISKEATRHARELVQLARLHADSAQPPRPPAKTMAQGGHIVLLCVGAESGFRIGLEHFVQPLRDKAATTQPPVVVLATSVPADWHEVVAYKKVYYLDGSPMSTFDLERAAIKLASAVFVCHASASMNRLAEPWMADSEVLCCARLVESQIGSASGTLVICEVACEDSYRFVPLRSTRSTKVNVRRSSVASTASSLSSESLGATGTDGQLALEDEEDEDEGKDEEQEYYQQPRYACGQLFVGTVVTCLVANTYYSASLSELVSAIIESKVTIVKMTREWIGKTYGEYFDSMLWSRELLSLGIYRQGEFIQGSLGSKKTGKLRYVYTTPPGQQTIMQESDLVICVGTSSLVLPADYQTGDAPELQDGAPY